MDWARRKRLMTRWAIFAAIILAIFWGTWGLFASVPVVTNIKITKTVSWPLPFPVSRYWDILFGPILLAFIIFILTGRKEMDDDVLRFTLFVTLFVGLFVGLLVGLFVYPVVGLVDGLIIGLGVSLYFCLAFSIYYGLSVGLDAVLSFGLGFDLGWGLGASLVAALGVALVAGLGVALVAGLVLAYLLLKSFFRKRTTMVNIVKWLMARE